MKFKVGDRVVCVGGTNANCIDKVGVIIGHEDNVKMYNVEFEEYIHGHSCLNKGNEGYCWNFYEEELKEEDLENDIHEEFEEGKLSYQIGDVVLTYRNDEVFLYRKSIRDNVEMYQGRIISRGDKRGCYITLPNEDIKDYAPNW